MIGIKDVEYILNMVADNITNTPQVKHLPFNKWLLASSMQKAIRRGDTKHGISATISLFHVDKRMLWRRLPIIALEDVGLGDAGAVSEALSISAATVWKNKVGELNSAVYAVRRLSEAVKSRTCTDAFVVSDMGQCCQSERNTLPGLDNEELMQIVRDSSQLITTRTLALWLIAGTDRYRSDSLPERKGDLSLAIDLMMEMDAPVPIIQSCILHLKKSPYPLALLLPLMFDAFEQRGGQKIENILPSTQAVNGLPLYAMDGLYTRDGKACIRQWRKESSTLMTYPMQLISMALFWLEGSVLNKEWQTPQTRILKQQSMMADFDSVGIKEGQQGTLLDVVQNNLLELMQIRADYLRKQQQDDLLGCAQ